MLNYRAIFSIKRPFFFSFSPLFCSIIACIFHVVLTFQSPNVASIVRNKTGSTMKQSHFRHTSPLNAWLPSLEQCLIVVGMASSFAKNQSDLRRFPSPEKVQLVTGYNTKMAELGNVFGTSFFCSETLYRCKRNEIFIRSSMESYEQ